MARNIKVGDIIKSYDFPGVLDCYKIGRVVDIIDVYILCDTLDEVFDGVTTKVPMPRQFRTVKQGEWFGDDKFNRILKVA